MAVEIYECERKLRRAIQTLQGGFLVLAVGLVWGLTPALSRMASGLVSNPLVLAVWVNAIAAVFCLSIAGYRGKFPRMTGKEFLFFLGWEILAGILQRLTTFVVTEHVEAAMLSLIVTLQGVHGFRLRGHHQTRARHSQEASSNQWQSGWCPQSEIAPKCKKIWQRATGSLQAPSRL